MFLMVMIKELYPRGNNKSYCENNFMFIVKFILYAIIGVKYGILRKPACTCREINKSLFVDSLQFFLTF
jgi:hypothetical protein